MAADSMASLEGTVQTATGIQTGMLQSFAYANKLARIKDYPIGVMFWGVGSIADRSVQSLVMEYEYGLLAKANNPNYSVTEIANGLLELLKNRYNATFPPLNQHPSMGLFVGGYSAGQFFAEEYSFDFPTSTDWTRVRPDQVGGRPTFGADWFGQSGPAQRFVKGWDTLALEELIRRGAPTPIVQQWVNDSIGEWQTVFDGMPIQDAIDYAKFIASLTIGWFRFGVGAPLCGGDVDVAVITPDAFVWADRKKWAIKA
jgi:hypothetical protein